MLLTMLKCKLHRGVVTDSDLQYEGSIGIDAHLLRAANMLPNERVDVLNINNGQRFSTYVIEAEAGSGQIIVNGAAARLVQKGDLIIICAFAQISEEEAKIYQPLVVQLNEQNKIKLNKHQDELMWKIKLDNQHPKEAAEYFFYKHSIIQSVPIKSVEEYEKPIDRLNEEIGTKQPTLRQSQALVAMAFGQNKILAPNVELLRGFSYDGIDMILEHGCASDMLASGMIELVNDTEGYEIIKITESGYNYIIQQYTRKKLVSLGVLSK